MKKILALSVLLALFSTGCLTCKKAYKSAGRISEIEAKLNEAIQRPSVEMQPTCSYMRTEGSLEFHKAAQMAEQAAMSKFFYTDSYCVAQVARRVCDRVYYGGRPYPGRRPHFYQIHCYDVFRCVQYKVVEHKLDGYEEALKVASNLRKVDSEVLSACSKADNDQMLSATIQMAKVRVQLGGEIKTDIYSIIGKAGCYQN